MSSESEEFKVGDSVLIVDANHDGELGTIIGIAAGPDGQLPEMVDGQHVLAIPVGWTVVSPHVKRVEQRIERVAVIQRLAPRVRGRKA